MINKNPSIQISEKIPDIIRATRIKNGRVKGKRFNKIDEPTTQSTKEDLYNA